MQKIIVSGGVPLSGHIRVSGSKNAALPLIFASLLVPGVTVLNNVPNIGDVSVALEIISNLGAKVTRKGDSLTVDATYIKYTAPNPELISKIRASTYLIGASLARFGIAEIGEFGGCNFSTRPIDFHLMAAEAMGAVRAGSRMIASGLRGAKIYLPKPSVGATTNAAIMAASASGVTEIFGYAKEPHVLAVLEFLSVIGASVEVGESSIKIKGAPLHGGEFTILGDMVEAGSYLICALATDGEITVSGVCPSELSELLNIISQLGYIAKVYEGSIYLNSKTKTRSECKSIQINAAPYPGFPTDLQPLFAPILAKCGGTITDSVWQGRFGYLSDLSDMGLISKRSFGCATIEPSRLHSAVVNAPDLRGGMALIIAALGVKGTSEILSPHLILRGYDSLIEKLKSLGADIKLVNL